MLRAAQVVVDEGMARPVLVGRTDVIAARVKRVRPAADARRRIARASTSSTTRAIKDYAQEYYQLARRKGVNAAAGARGNAHAPDADRRDAACAAATPTRCCAARSATTPTTCGTCDR